jgi:hypothetical protein
MLHRVVSTLPHKSELKDEHFLMAVGYGVGAFLVHSAIGMMIVGVCYLAVAMISVHDHRSN